MTLFTSGITYWDFFGATRFILLPIYPVSLLGTGGIPVEDSHSDERRAWLWESESPHLGSWMIAGGGGGVSNVNVQPQILKLHLHREKIIWIITSCTGAFCLLRGAAPGPLRMHKFRVLLLGCEGVHAARNTWNVYWEERKRVQVEKSPHTGFVLPEAQTMSLFLPYLCTHQAAPQSSRVGRNRAPGTGRSSALQDTYAKTCALQVVC